MGLVYTELILMRLLKKLLTYRTLELTSTEQ